MMRDAYQTINKSFEPSQGDVKSYFEVLDCVNEGQVGYKDLEKHVIRFLIGEDYDVRGGQKDVAGVLLLGSVMIGIRGGALLAASVFETAVFVATAWSRDAHWH